MATSQSPTSDTEVASHRQCSKKDSKRAPKLDRQTLGKRWGVSWLEGGEVP